MKTEKLISFEDAVRPLIQWLCENENPHCKIIVSNDGAQLIEERLGTGQILDYIAD